jgi:hypothetical protein
VSEPEARDRGARGVERAAPQLTAALVVGARRDRARRALTALGRQTVVGALEIVVADVAPPDAAPLELPPGVEVVHLRLDPAVTWSQARAEAVRRARGPIVAFVEEHAVPALDWAEVLVAAHRGPWAAVGYAFTNANPGTYMGRACLLGDYGLWAHPATRGPTHLLPGNNVSYKRELLLALGPRLEPAMGADFNVHESFLGRGLTLFLEPRALVAHENYERLSEMLAANHTYCRLLAAGRVRTQGWGWGRRLAYALAVPLLVPPLKVARLARSLRGRGTLVPGVLAASPVILVTYLWSAVGEALGYVLGAGGAEGHFKWWELESRRAGSG